MSSIIEGYNYDIFISYRQKDNKHDGWVTKFVDNLKGELEATFKEDISVYFDENPHDRLQETHNVDKSLEDKLKCLIFITILSQTYCDPNSYAWQYELLAFLKMVQQDRFGKDIKLRNGNVSSRILPIRIHDLEPEDVKLFEKETGSVLRAMDFVFKTSSGVIRPLKTNEDHPQDNLNKTFYGDQINKVTLAIKEIIYGIRSQLAHAGQETVIHAKFSAEEKNGNIKKSVISHKNKTFVTVASTILILAAILMYLKIFVRDKDNTGASDQRLSITILPFKNMTNDTIWNIWQNGIKDNLITRLSNYPKDLLVKPIQSIDDLLQSKGITNYASITPSIAGRISQKLNSKVFVTGSINRAGSIVRVNTQLIDTKTEEVFKSFQLEGTSEGDIFGIIDSLSVLVKNYLSVFMLGKKISREFKSSISTYSLDAYKYYIYGEKAFFELDYPTACQWFLQAIKADSNFTACMVRLGYAYLNQGLYEDAKKWCLRSLSDKKQYNDNINTSPLYATLFETPDEVIKCYRFILANDDQSPIPYFNIGHAYNKLNQYKKAIPELEKELKIYKEWDSRPRWVNSYTTLGNAYHRMGMYKEERKLYKKAEKDFPDNLSLIFRQAILSLSEGDSILAGGYISKYKLLSRGTDEEIQTRIAEIYYEAGILDRAEQFYSEALVSAPLNPRMLNNLSYFLIDNDRNIVKGIELAQKALEIKPNNFNSLHNKGWGLYKQGKYKEAFDLLQRSWDIRRKEAIYDHAAFLHLEEARRQLPNEY